MKRIISALAASLVCAGACAAAATARTANSSAATKQCSKVSAGSVSSVVGHQLPTGVGMIINEKATKKNFNVAYQTLSCTYGLETSLAALKKSVIISEETLSRSLSSKELKKLLQIQQKTTGTKIKIVPYSGLGGTAYYMSFSDANIDVQSIITASGTKFYGATVDSSTVTKSQLASLVKLAQKL
jgi:hypothetical protein